MSVGFDADSKHVVARLCNDFVYFAGKGPYYTPHRAFMTLDGFRQFVGQHYGILNFTRVMTDQKTGTQTEIEDTIPAAEWWLNTRPELKRVVSELVFEPGVATPPEKFNTWDIQKHEMCQPVPNTNISDIRPLVEHLLFISDDETESVVWILNWLAHLYQFPAVKIPSFVCFHSDFGGVGKSMLKQLLNPVFGESMIGSMSGHHLHGDFSDLLFGNRLVFVEEVAFENRRTTYEKFKELVSEPHFSHNPKGRMAFKARNTMHFIVCTNRIDALPLMRDDRRAMVVSCPHRPKPQQYYRDFVAWIKGPGPGLLAGVLSGWDLSNFDPGEHPPQTGAARRMHNESRSALEQFIEGLVTECAPPFEKDFGTARELVIRLGLLYEDSTRSMGLNEITLGKVLKSLGTDRLSVRIRDGENPRYVWFWRNAEHWKKETVGARMSHLGIS
jgi:hypothetical protein